MFNKRPMDANLEKYCVNDVVILPLLRDLYWGRLGAAWKAKVAEATEARIVESQGAAYQPQSESKKFGPWEGVYSVVGNW